MMLHFAEGLPHNNFKKLQFSQYGLKYCVTGFVQYRNDPDHFVTWIQRVKGNIFITKFIKIQNIINCTSEEVFISLGTTCDRSVGFSTNKTDDIAEILLKVALNTIHTLGTKHRFSSPKQ